MDNDFRPAARHIPRPEPRPINRQPPQFNPTPAQVSSSAGSREVTKPQARSSYRTWVLLTVVSATILLGGALWYKHNSDSKSVLPVSVRSAVTFSIFYPIPASGIKVQTTAAQYDATEKRLSFSATTPGGVKIDFSQQATPDAFVDIPQAFDKLTASLQQYSRFDSPSGTVILTHPKELGGSQSAVMNSKGTLLFARPSRNLTNDEWRVVFNNLQIVR